MKNFIKLGDLSILSVPYMYIDHKAYLADALFEQSQIHMRFKEEFAHKNSSYCIIFCRVRKRDIIKFEAALGLLTNKMLLLGYTHYPDACNEIMGLLEKERGVA